MCVYSMVSDHFMHQYPSPYTFPPAAYPDMAELLRKARLYDEMMKQPACPEAEKARWVAEVERIMREKYGLVVVEPKAPTAP